MPKGNYYHFFIIPYLISLLGNYLLENSQPRMREAYRTKYTLKHFPAPSSGKCVNIKKKRQKKEKEKKKKRNEEKSPPQGSHNILQERQT